MEPYIFYALVAIIFGSVLAFYFLVVQANQSKEQIRTPMYTTIGVSAGIGFIFTLVSYFFFTSNTEYAFPYLLFMSGLNTVLSVSALGVSMINVNHA
jgi:ABC-type Fe3+-siderophore transport system permease subunit